jgi:hypothetical protein
LFSQVRKGKKEKVTFLIRGEKPWLKEACIRRALDSIAFVFDLDGVLVDAAENHFLAWKRLANYLGFNFRWRSCPTS